jgi:hypothetical protein
MTDITDLGYPPNVVDAAREMAKRRSLVHAKNQAIADLEKQKAAAIAKIKLDPLADPKDVNHVNNHYNGQVADVKARFKALSGGYSTAVNVTDSALQKILADPELKLKSAFEVGTGLDRKPEYNDIRKQWEQKALGIAPDAPVSERPVYGYLLARNAAHPNFSTQSVPASFGDTALVMGDNVRNNSTFVQGGGAVATKNTNVRSLASNKNLADAIAHGGMQETHTIGGIPLRDNLKAVVVPNEKVATTQAALAKAGLQVPVRTATQHEAATQAESLAGRLAMLARQTGRTPSALIRTLARLPISKGLNSFLGVAGFLPMLADAGQLFSGKVPDSMKNDPIMQKVLGGGNRNVVQ